MSRIGKKPVVLPGGVTVDIKNDRELTVKGPKGELSQTFRPEVALKLSDASGRSLRRLKQFSARGSPC